MLRLILVEVVFPCLFVEHLALKELGESLGRCRLRLGLTSFLVSVSHPQRLELFLYLFFSFIMVYFWWVDSFWNDRVIHFF